MELTKAEMRVELEAALATYNGPVTHCPRGTPPDENAEQREQRKFDRAPRQIARFLQRYPSAADRQQHR